MHRMGDMSLVILRTKHNGVFTGKIKTLNAPLSENGVGVELDAKTGILLWCPKDQIEELIQVPAATEDEKD